MKTSSKAKKATKSVKKIKFSNRFVMRVTLDVNDFHERELMYL